MMREFILEGRDHAARAETDFVLGFIEAMFFTETGCTDSSEWLNTPEDVRTSDGQLPRDMGYTDLHPDSLAAIRADCEAWQAANADLLAQAYAAGDYDAAQAGRDYWFTRNGHGVGFWDRKELDSPGRIGTGLSIGQRLSDACRYREVYAFYGQHVTHGDAPFVHVDL